MSALPVRLPAGKKEQKPENALRSACLKWLKIRFGRHFWQLKIAGGAYQRTGSPDTICSIRGRLFAFEWKDPARKPSPKSIAHAKANSVDEDLVLASPKQQDCLMEIRAAGGKAFVISAWIHVVAAVEDIEPVQLGIV